MKNETKRAGITRRMALGTMATVIAAPAILRHTQAYAATPKLKIGHVSPRTGPLAGFGEADDWVISEIRKIFAAGLDQ